MTSSVSNRSLIELLSLQRGSDGHNGLRLTLHWTLLERLELSSYPYHWAGLTGSIPLALYLYKHKHQAQRNDPVVATISSGGINGQAPWRKSLEATAADVARMAGYARLGDVLTNIERDIPLIWEPSVHPHYSDACRSEIRRTMDTLCSSGWFITLPGPARQRVVQAYVTEACREHAWGMVQEEEWAQAEKGEFGPALLEDLSRLLRKPSLQSLAGSPTNPTQPGPNNNNHNQLPQALARELAAVNEPLRQFQFRMAYSAAADGVALPGGAHNGAPRRRKHRFWRLAAGASLALLALSLTARECRRLKRDQVAAYVAGTLAGLQLPSVLLLIAQILDSL